MDVRTGETSVLGRHKAAAVMTVFSPDGRYLFTGGWDCELICRDVKTMRRAFTIDLDSYVMQFRAVVDEAGNTGLGFAPNGELFASRSGECFRWRVNAGTNGAAPALERLAMSKPAGFVSLCLLSNGVVLTSTRGSKLAGFDQLATGQGAWKPTVDGLNGTSPDGRWLGMLRSWGPHLYIHRLPRLERVAMLTNEAPISLFEFAPGRRGGDCVPPRGRILEHHNLEATAPPTQLHGHALLT